MKKSYNTNKIHIMASINENKSNDENDNGGGSSDIEHKVIAKSQELKTIGDQIKNKPRYLPSIDIPPRQTMRDRPSPPHHRTINNNTGYICCIDCDTPDDCGSPGECGSP